MMPVWSVNDSALQVHTGKLLMASYPLEVKRHQTAAQALAVAAMRISARLGVPYHPGHWTDDYARGFWQGVNSVMADRVERRAA